MIDLHMIAKTLRHGFGVFGLAVLATLCALPATGQDDATEVTLTETNEGFTFNLRGADLAVFAEQIADITGRTLVLDPNVAGTVTVISKNPLDKVGVWDLFQSVLGLNGLTAVKSGDLWRVIPLEAATGAGAVRGETADKAGRLDMVTRLLALQSFPAQSAVEALRPLLSPNGILESVPGTNTLIVTDTSETVDRVQSIARDLDTSERDQVFTIKVRDGSAPEIGAALQAVLSGDEGGPRITVDPRANTIIVRGTGNIRTMVETIVTDLDVPATRENATVPVIRMYRLQHVNAASMAGVLGGLLGQPGGGAGNDVTNDVVGALAQTASVDAATSAPQDDPLAALSAFQSQDGPTIQAVTETNAIVVRALPSIQREVANVIASLDQRRPQVLIEAAIVEVSGEVAEQLGIQLGFGAATPPGGFAATSYSPSGPALANVLSVLGVPEAAAIARAGLSAGANTDDFGILLQALGQSNKARLLSTPSIMTLDNQPAEIIVGQNVPFRTGSFVADENGVNTFTTIERQDVGITLRVVPRVNDGDAVQLDVNQEVSALTDTAVDGAADLVTNRRSIKTTVLADNGGTIVLGGLITNDSQSAGSQVPGISRVPLIGELFKSRTEKRRKQTLFVFLRPTILRNRMESAAVAEDRYQRLRSIDVDAQDDRSPLAEGSKVRQLPVEIDGIY